MIIHWLGHCHFNLKSLLTILIFLNYGKNEYYTSQFTKKAKNEILKIIAPFHCSLFSVKYWKKWEREWAIPVRGNWPRKTKFPRNQSAKSNVRFPSKRTTESNLIQINLVSVHQIHVQTNYSQSHTKFSSLLTPHRHSKLDQFF